MNLTVSLEQRFSITPDGRAWTRSVFRNDYWQRYLNVFDKVRVAARALPVEHPREGELEVSGDDVSFFPFPYYVGPEGYVKALASTRAAARKLLQDDSAHIIRAPSPLGFQIYRNLGQKAFGLRVVGDPMQSISALGHWASRPLSYAAGRQLRELCGHAVAIAYVTEQVLQHSYPASSTAFTIGYSDVSLPEQAFAESRQIRALDGDANILFVGTLDALYKGQETLLSACASLKKDRLLGGLTIVGEGRYRGRLEEIAHRLGIASKVRFIGYLADVKELQREYQQADIFVLPSWTEGLPRVLLEAMAQGVPSLGTTVGGIVELLEPCYLVPPRDSGALAQKIKWLLCDKSQMVKASERNLARAREFESNRLHEKRLKFLLALKEATIGSSRGDSQTS